MHMAKGKTIKWHMRTSMKKTNHFLPYFNFYVQIYSTEVFFFKLMKAFMCFFKQYFQCLVEIFETIYILIKIPIQWGHKAKWIN